jgi:hypothetical protein
MINEPTLGSRANRCHLPSISLTDSGTILSEKCKTITIAILRRCHGSKVAVKCRDKDKVGIIFPLTDFPLNWDHRVSSTLDKSVGKKHLTDGSAETCWTSQQVGGCALDCVVALLFNHPIIALLLFVIGVTSVYPALVSNPRSSIPPITNVPGRICWHTMCSRRVTQ